MKSLAEFDFTHQPGVRHDQIAALAGGGFLRQARNIVLLGHRHHDSDGHLPS